GRTGGESFSKIRLRRLPSSHRHEPGPFSCWPLRKDRAAPTRDYGYRRRKLHPRVDRRSARKNRCRVSADHADFQGLGQRRSDSPDYCLHQVFERARKEAIAKMNDFEIERREHYLNVNYGIRSWLFTTDHKRIAWLYLLSVTVFFFIGGFYATLIRLELMTP